MILSCSTPRQFSVGDSVSKSQYERLLKEFNKSQANADLASKLKYAYGQREAEYLQAISSLQGQAAPRAKEQLLNQYTKLNQFYNEARATPALDRLLQPGDVTRQITDTRLLAADAWYTEAEQLLHNGGWQQARQAQDALQKVNRWYPGYKNSPRLLARAAEEAVVDVVIAPMRNEGFFSGSNFGNGFGNGFGQSLNAQLASDLGGRFANPGRLRAWDGAMMGMSHNGANPDVVVEPVWTRWQLSPENRTNQNRTVSKQVENGRDSIGRKLYKTITATLNITEVTQETRAELELRISDVASRRALNSRTWRETHTTSQTWATFTGDANALGANEWELLRNPQTIMQPSNEWLQVKILERIYPEILQHLRSQLQ
ncbi:MAG: hypothetical protein EAY75_03440 [Bacteroidetes bacterium]|nr:MAG: hypothetical protein EAY75_03440 [Bacteroidota bacterium]